MSFASLCNSTATIQRPTYTADAQGGQVATFAAIYSNIPVSMQPAKGRAVELFARRSMQVDTVFYTPVAVTVQTGDRVLHNSIYYIVVTGQDQAGRGEVYAVYTRKLD